MERFLAQCLESICSQTLENIEIICVNDGSTDDSRNIIEKFKNLDNRIHIVDKQNSGYGDSMNKGIAAARGKYIGIVEPDDWVMQNMFETLYTAAQRHQYPDIVKGAYWRICHADSQEEEKLPAYYLNVFKPVDTVFTLEQNADFLLYHPSIWTAIYKTSFLSECQISFKPIPGSGWADNPFLMESLTSARSIVYIDEPLYCYREFNTGSSSEVKDPSIIYNRWLEMDEILKRKNITSPKILEGHYCRGCAYIEMLDNDFPANEEAHQGVERMLSCMDKNVILNSDKIIERFKNSYLNHCGVGTRFAFKLKRKLSNS